VRPAVIRWLRFNAVGMIGAALQVAVLSLLVKLGAHYLVATAIAVEAAILHNYAWHRRWTWAGRPSDGRLGRFHAANGLVSIISNVVWMRVFTGTFVIAPAPANVMAIALTSLLNFALSDRWVFPQRTFSRRTARKVASSVLFKDSRGSDPIMGRKAHPSPAGMSRVSEMARHSTYVPSGRGSINQ